MRDYGDQDELDPVGPEDEAAHRAMRGGSWFDDARGARSAYRRAHPPGDADDYLGFRLCLRSIEPGQAPGRPGGPAGFARIKRAAADWLGPDRKR